MPMMMGAGLLVMLVFFFLLVGILVLVIGLALRGGLTELFKPRSRARSSDPTSPPAVEHTRKCPTCERAVKADWNVCPSCGAALT